MQPFTPADYGPVFAELVNVDRRRPLGAGKPQDSFAEKLRAATLETAFAHTSVTDESMARCALSGLWLLHDFLDESHTISQSIESPTGSFWHGVMHRREGDFSNAKYWFRRVGEHPAYEAIAERVAEEVDGGEQLLDGEAWDPLAFVDACEAALRSGEQISHCEQAQQIEWETLFDYCYRETQ